MIARKAAAPAVLACALLAAMARVGTTSILAASQVEADPHELYDRARQHLEQGRLQEAAAAAAKLHALVSTRPEWDPEGTFAKELLPPLQARLKRLEAAARALDHFADQALRDLKPPQLKDDISTVRDYTHWATAEVQRLRAERDALIRAVLTDPEEVAILARTGSYARTERLFETDMLEKMAETAGDDILGLLSGDPRLEAVLVRFRQLKRDLMASTEERDQLQARVKKAEDRHVALLDALASVVTDGAAPRSRPGAGEPASPGDRFARFLSGEQEALHQRPSLTVAERDRLRANLERYGTYNKVLAAAGAGADQSAEIAALAQAIENIPIQDGPVAASPTLAWGCGSLVAALAACTGFLAWLAITRGRRLASLEHRGDQGSGWVARRDGGADAGRNAA